MRKLGQSLLKGRMMKAMSIRRLLMHVVSGSANGLIGLKTGDSETFYFYFRPCFKYLFSNI